MWEQINKNIFLIMITVVTAILSYWWYLTYSTSDEYVLYFKTNGRIDTTHHYIVAPRYMEKKVVGSDTLLNFYNKHHEYVITVPIDSANNLLLYKIKDGKLNQY